MALRPRRAWPRWLLLALGVLGAAFGMMGYAMQASFSVADPPGAPPRDAIAAGFFALTVLSIIVAIAAAATLALRAGLHPPGPDRAISASERASEGRD